MTWQLSWIRTGVAIGAGVAAAAVLWSLVGPVQAMAGGWIVLALTYICWTLLAILPMSPQQAAEHATQEDPSHAAATLVLTLAALASVAGVGVLLSGSHGGPELPEAFLGVADVVCSWVLVHTLYTVRYARLYYQQPSAKPIDFNGDQPDYHDFAYLAFTLGMTYQVSDTALQTRAVRRAALRHALLSYLLGAVVLACTINLVVQVASN